MEAGTPMGRELKTTLVGLSLTLPIITLIRLSELFVNQLLDYGNDY